MSPQVSGEEEAMRRYTTEASTPRRAVCPSCETGELTPGGAGAARCAGCGFLVGPGLLEALKEIASLPDARGKHACECGHPEMRLLPDGVFRCPACGAEVLPIKSSGRR
jgi:ribosomal protein L37AE/L43A